MPKNQFLLFLFVIITTTLASAEDQNCYRLLNPTFAAEDSVTLEDLSLKILTNSDLREKILTRKNSLIGKHFVLMPELKPVLAQMFDELNGVENRLIATKTSWSMRTYIRGEVYKFKATIALLQRVPAYIDILKFSIRFAGLMSIVSRLEGEPNEFGPSLPGADKLEILINFLADHQLTLVRHVNLVIWLSQRFDILFLPTFAELSVPHMNRLWALGIYPIGLSGKYKKFDGTRGLLTYTTHDIGHGISMITRNSPFHDGIFGRESRWPFKFQFAAQEKFNAELKKSGEMDSVLLSELDQFTLDQEILVGTETTTRAAIEELYFEIRHERYALPARGSLDKIILALISDARSSDPYKCVAYKWLMLRWHKQGISFENSSTLFGVDCGLKKNP